MVNQPGQTAFGRLSFPTPEMPNRKSGNVASCDALVAKVIF